MAFGQNDALLTLGALTLTPFGLTMALGAALAVLMTVLLSGSHLPRSRALNAALCAIPGALIGGHLVYCLTMIGSILTDYSAGLSILYLFNMGGYTLYGAVLGALAALLIYARVSGQKLAPLADIVAPGAALALCLGRAAEYFIGQGIGEYVEDEALQHFPLLICTYADEYWSEWHLPVFVYEALTALIILGVVLAVYRRARTSGRAAEVFVGLLGVTQVFLESLRRDEFIRFGFVRFTQLAAAVTLAAVLFLSVRRVVLSRGWDGWQKGRIALFVVCVGIVIAIEFALDKSPIDNLLLYSVMVVNQIAMGFAVLREGK